MASTINSKKSSTAMDFLKQAGKYIGAGTKDYFVEATPTISSTISETASTVGQISSTIKNTTASVLPKIRQLKSQTNLRSMLNWFTSKEDEFDSNGFDNDLGEWDDGTSAADLAEGQISEAKENANQISGAIVESIHKSVESQISMSANIMASLDSQSAIIKSGFQTTNETLGKILEIMTKNTAALIETTASVSSSDNPEADMVANGKFNLSKYKDIVKSNLSKSELGAAGSMVNSMFQMVKGGGITPGDLMSMLVGFGIDKAAPNLRKGLQAFDDVVSDTIMQSLIRLGSKGGYGPGGFFARMFGIDASRQQIDTSRPSIGIKSIPFDTITKDAITSAIPGYLRKILVALGGDDEIYDYRSRTFRSKKAIHDDYLRQSTAFAGGSMYNASTSVQSKLGSDEWTMMMYDLIVNDIGRRMGPYGDANQVVKKLNDPKFAKEYLGGLLGDKRLDNDNTNIDIMASNMSKLDGQFDSETILKQASMANVKRNTAMKKYVEEANKYGVDLSFIKDDPRKDADYLKERYGRAELAESNISTEPSTADLTGIDYTHAALFEIYRRLDNGLNVYQVGSDNSQGSPFEKFDEKYLKKPAKYKPKTIVATRVPGIIAAIANSESNHDSGENLLRNGVDEEGNPENLSKLDRVKRWGKHRGGQFVGAMMHGSSEDIKLVIEDTMKDVSGIAGDAMKKGMDSINTKFGNISGFLGHKLFGTEYKYNEVGPDGKMIEKTIGKNENGGVFGFVKDKITGMLGDAKDKGKKWFSEVAGYFDYGDKGDSKDGQVAGKRKKILSASVGAMAGAGILGGPIGLLMGAIAGNAIGGIPNIGEKLKEKLFGKDKETGKPTGLLSKAADAVITPIQYQFAKTMNYVGEKLKKSVFGPLSDLGYVIKNRVAGKASEIFGKVWGKVLDLGAKALGGLGKLGGKIFEGIVGYKGGKARAKVGAAATVFGGGVNLLTNALMSGKQNEKLREDVKERRRARREEIEKNREKFGSIKAFRKDKWAKNKDKDNIAELGRYTEEQVISTREIEDSNNEIKESNAAIRDSNENIAENTGKTVEAITDLKNSLAGGGNTPAMKADGSEHTSEAAIANGTTGLPNNMKVPDTSSGDSTVSGKNPVEERKEAQKKENQEFGNTLLSSGVTVADEGGVDNPDVKGITDIGTSAARGESKETLFGKFKNLLKRNQDKADANAKDEEKKSESFISKLIGGVGSLVTKYWPYVLGAFMLLSDKFRGVITDFAFNAGNWLIEHLPNLISSALGLGKAANRTIENQATGSTTVKDEVTGESKSVTSAEQHAEHKEKGALQSAIGITMNPLRLAKDALLISGAKAGIRGAATAVQVAGGGTALLSGAANMGVRGFHAASAFAQGITGGSGLANSWRNAGMAFRMGGSQTLSSISKGGSNVVKGAGSFKNLYSKFKPSKLFKLTDAKVANAWGGAFAGMAGQVGASIGWETMEISKNKNIVGDYGFGNAGGFVRTSTSVKTATVLTASIGATAIAGAALGAQIAAAAGALAAGIGALGTANFWNPVGWAALIIAGIVAITAAFAALVNWITGLVTDAEDRAYSIRSNASKLQGVIDGKVSYENGKKNPRYVYCGQESDRTIGFTKGLNMYDPEIVFGRYIKTLMDGLTSSPGSEVLLYDWINNMAVQGVPFACYIAGDSNEASVKGNQANKDTTGDPPSDHKSFGSAVLMGAVAGTTNAAKTQVRQSTVVKNKDKIHADIIANINRQNPEVSWSWDVLETVYNAGREVVMDLTRFGILNNKGSVNTDRFKGKPDRNKNDSSGWFALRGLCKEKGSYYLTKCLVYINSKIEANKQGQQWLEVRKDDVATLLDSLKDVLLKEHEDLVEDMRNKGMSDEEIEDALKEMTDPKGKKAEGAADLVDATDQVISSVAPDIRTTDRPNIKKELQYIAAGYAYSHPEYLQSWVEHNRNLTEFGIDDVEGGHIANWDTFTKDKKEKKTIRSLMRNAALEFGKRAGDIYNLLPQFDWSSDGKLYGSNSKKVDKYGAEFVIRGQELKDGEGILDKVFSGASDNTPDEVHDKMFGRIRHNMGAEAATTSGLDATKGGNGVMARIAEKIGDYSSESGQELTSGSSPTKWRNAVVNLPVRSPVNLPNPATGFAEKVDDDLDIEGVGGPKELSQIAIDDGGSASTEEVQESGGNPLVNKGFKITSTFGPRTNPHSGMHNGIDLVPDDGSGQSEVGSRFSGKIVSVKDDVPDSVHAEKIGGRWTFPYASDQQTGNMVTIQTDDGMIVKNMHLKAGSIPSNIKPGAEIKVGDRIGTMGSTGWSTGNHLHYEFRNQNNEAIDPTDSLSETTGWSQAASTGTYNPSSSSAMASTESYSMSANTSSESSSEKGTLASFIDKLKSIGNQFLSKITGGLLGSEDSSDSEINMSSTGSVGSLGSAGSAQYLTGNCNNQWITVVRDVKKLVAEQQPVYNQSGSMTINYNGKNLKLRPDCTGIICAMLKLYGVMDENDNLNSTLMLKPGAIKNGFDQADWPGWENLVEGDILVNDGHAEIFAFNEGNRHYVYNGGSTEALRTPGASASSKSSYIRIWRCREEVTAMPVAGADVDAEGIWDYLRAQNLNEYATAGLMGNLYAESGLKTNNLQNSYEGRLGSDEQYTSKVNSGEYQNFANDSAGYGLAQWTSSGRKAALYQRAKSAGKSIDDGDVQLGHLMAELNSSYRNSVLNKLMGAQSVKEASDVVLHKFEAPADQSAAVENKRAGYGQTFYNQFSGKGSGSTSNATSDAGFEPVSMDATDGMGGPDYTYDSIEESQAQNASISQRTNYTQKQFTDQPRQQSNSPTKIKNPFRGEITPNSEYGEWSDRNITIDNNEVAELLREVIIELRAINGNTGNSNNLLQALGENGIQDKDLRNQLGQYKSKSGTTGAGRNSSNRNANSMSNNKMISSMIRP